jgi:hypothetical protein
MRGRKLVELRNMLKAELGMSLEVGVAPQADRRLDLLLENKQLLLSSQLDWPFLERLWDTPVAAAVSTVPMPINPPDERINTERPMKVEVLFDTFYQPVFYGVDSCEWNTMTAPQDPIQQWRYKSDEALGDVLEVWPTPVTAQTLRITAQRRLRPLKADTDVTDLDDLLLVYFVAADLTQEADSKSAPIKAMMAKERLRSVTQGLVSRSEPFVLGANLLPRKTHRNVPIVIVH